MLPPGAVALGLPAPIASTWFDGEINTEQAAWRRTALAVEPRAARRRPPRPRGPTTTRSGDVVSVMWASAIHEPLGGAAEAQAFEQPCTSGAGGEQGGVGERVEYEPGVCLCHEVLQEHVVAGGEQTPRCGWLPGVGCGGPLGSDGCCERGLAEVTTEMRYPGQWWLVIHSQTTSAAAEPSSPKTSWGTGVFMRNSSGVMGSGLASPTGPAHDGFNGLGRRA